MRTLSILAVDRSPGNLALLSRLLSGEQYALRSASDLAGFDSVLSREGCLGFALIDVTGFDPGIWERCEQLNRCRVPWIAIAPQCSLAACEREGLRRGARCVLAKPLRTSTLLELIRGALAEPR